MKSKRLIRTVALTLSILTIPLAGNNEVFSKINREIGLLQEANALSSRLNVNIVPDQQYAVLDAITNRYLSWVYPFGDGIVAIGCADNFYVYNMNTNSLVAKLNIFSTSVSNGDVSASSVDFSNKDYILAYVYNGSSGANLFYEVKITKDSITKTGRTFNSSNLPKSKDENGTEYTSISELTNYYRIYDHYYSSGYGAVYSYTANNQTVSVSQDLLNNTNRKLLISLGDELNLNVFSLYDTNLNLCSTYKVTDTSKVDLSLVDSRGYTLASAYIKIPDTVEYCGKTYAVDTENFDNYNAKYWKNCIFDFGIRKPPATTNGYNKVRFYDKNNKLVNTYLVSDGADISDRLPNIKIDGELVDDWLAMDGVYLGNISTNCRFKSSSYEYVAPTPAKVDNPILSSTVTQSANRQAGIEITAN